ncbi:hypothetical protein PJF56_17345 [Roseofilum sp. BLCC_M91]|uniref:Uncharacterized protein n=1 Tax=Roseofilum halophilum BLCC-M91 TaxID=3022259 RepID=A0ABT7BN50_9CYAN|nr:hypothetical protein [Roseofilum halophilum]MDJ1180627.1 hypothetical protein [Roseofilum halophilum BLCC-M91]
MSDRQNRVSNIKSNFVDPHIQQLTSVPSHTPPMIPAHPVIGFGCASGWLLVTFAYCLMTRKMRGV